MDKFSLMQTLKTVYSACPDLFPLNADELDAIERKARQTPDQLTEHEMFLKTVADIQYYLWTLYSEEDPENGEKKFYDDLNN